MPTSANLGRIVWASLLTGLLAACARESEEPPVYPTCFGQGTQVATPDGGMAIETLRVGQKVLTYDPEQAQIVVGEVTNVFAHPDASVGTIELPTGDELAITGEHPVLLNRRFAPVDQVKAGDSLCMLDPSSERASSLRAAIAPFRSRQRGTTYDIEVQPHHNFFANRLLVHNKSVQAVCDGGECKPQATPPVVVSPPLVNCGRIEEPDAGHPHDPEAMERDASAE